MVGNLGIRAGEEILGNVEKGKRGNGEQEETVEKEEKLGRQARKDGKCRRMGKGKGRQD
jgi:hypothetical protein